MVPYKPLICPNVATTSVADPIEPFVKRFVLKPLIVVFVPPEAVVKVSVSYVNPDA